MRIKKKDVLTEALLIDVTTEFTPLEKKIFRIFKKKYGGGGYSSEFDRWESAAWLIEHMGFDHNEAFDLSLTYWYNGDKLFKDTEPLRKKESRGYLFSKIIHEFPDSYKETKGEDLGVVEMKWYDQNDIMGRGNNFTSPSEADLWTSYRGFNIYLPFDEPSYRRTYQFRDTLTVMGRLKYEEVSKTSYDVERDENANFNHFYRVVFNLERKNLEGGTDILYETKSKRKIPSKLNKETVFNIYTKDIEKLLNIAKEQTFLIPEVDVDVED
jgi:hypothetical protein